MWFQECKQSAIFPFSYQKVSMMWWGEELSSAMPGTGEAETEVSVNLDQGNKNKAYSKVSNSLLSYFQKSHFVNTWAVKIPCLSPQKFTSRGVIFKVTNRELGCSFICCFLLSNESLTLYSSSLLELGFFYLLCLFVFLIFKTLRMSRLSPSPSLRGSVEGSLKGLRSNYCELLML